MPPGRAGGGNRAHEKADSKKAHFRRPPRSDQNHRSRLVEADDRRRSGRLPFGPLLRNHAITAGTAVVIYAVEFPEKLSRRALAALRNLDNAIELSAVSVTEIAIKAASGKLAFSAVILRKAMDDLGIRILPYTADHASACSGFRAIMAIPLTAKSLLRRCARTFRL